MCVCESVCDRSFSNCPLEHETTHADILTPALQTYYTHTLTSVSAVEQSCNQELSCSAFSMLTLS